MARRGARRNTARWCCGAQGEPSRREATRGGRARAPASPPRGGRPPKPPRRAPSTPAPLPPPTPNTRPLAGALCGHPCVRRHMRPRAQRGTRRVARQGSLRHSLPFTTSSHLGGVPWAPLLGASGARARRGGAGGRERLPVRGVARSGRRLVACRARPLCVGMFGRPGRAPPRLRPRGAVVDRKGG